MKKMLKEYFTFTAKQRNGLIGVFILLGLALLYLNVDFNSAEDDGTDMQQFKEDLAALKQESEKSAYTTQATSDSKSKENSKKSDPYEFHEFDPNEISDEEWLKMGLKQWQVNAIKAYRAKAGNFQKPEDLAKLNAIPVDFHQKIRPFLRFNENNKSETLEVSPDHNEKIKPLLINVNQAFTHDLVKIKGIGPAFSSRILKYRNWLGGFYKLDQLLEVYGLKDSLYQEIIPFLTLDTNQIRKININSIMILELKKHPYINWNTARAIVNYRDQHGDYNSVQDIRKTDLVSAELYRKIAPYFSVSNN